MSNNAHELSNRLLNALDSNYNVVDMQTVNEIISILEKFNITKELLETTRLGKHVNELRRKTTEPTLARRAKVLVKRWRDLVIPAVASPAHTGSNRSSAERAVRRLGGTPLTSPALSRQVVSPAVPSPRPPSRPAWGGYESDSQDVILVDDDPASPSPAPPAPPPLTPHKSITPPVKRPPSPEPLYDEKKAKRDKKPKKKRPGHSRAGSGTEATGGEAPPPSHALPHGALPSQGVHPQGANHAWGSRNGSGRRNGWRRDAPDPYAALVNRLPPAGAKVKTTKELLEQIQLRGSAVPSRPASPRSPDSPHSPDVMVIEPDPPIKVDSPLRNGNSDSKLITVDVDDEKPTLRSSPAPTALPPLEDERPYVECTCGEAGEEGAIEGEDGCPAAAHAALRPLHVRALHHALLPGVNGTRAPPAPHRFAVRTPARLDDPALFASVVPLYQYSDYADDYCVKNLARVSLCPRLPWTQFAPAPASPPPPPSPPPLRPYPDEPAASAPPDPPPAAPALSPPTSPAAQRAPAPALARPTVGPEMMSLPVLEPSERLKAPILSAEDVTQFGEPRRDVREVKEFVAASPEHRTVEKTKAEHVDGRALYALCKAALNRVPYSYEQTACAPVVTLPLVPAGEAEAEATLEAEAALERALEDSVASTTRDALGRPERPALFAEWHECARLGDLVALPYVVID